MATLAQRLNELATANAEGLLNDDAYRLLRQDVFERYADDSTGTLGTTILGQTPLSPPKVMFQTPASPSSPTPTTSQPKPHSPSFTSYFRRHGSKNDGKSASPSPSEHRSNGGLLKRAFMLRKSPRKQGADIASKRTSLFSGTSNADAIPRVTLAPRSVHSPATSRSDSVFVDGGLSTTKELRQRIKDVEEEGRRVLKAFDELEQSMALRTLLQKQDQPPDLRGANPETLLTPNHIQYNSDTLYLKSATSLPLESPSPQPRLKRKGSLSSMSSQGTSLLSVRPDIGSQSSLSRSTGHHLLSAVYERGSEQQSPMDPDDPNIDDIRRRRADVTRRYEARLEYLRARLKGAELHEKVLKK